MQKYTLEGTPNSPVLIFSNSLGAQLSMWDDLTPYLLPYFRILRYDTRGHGANANTISNNLKIDDLGKDVIAIMDSLSIESAYFCGLSMGGLIGQWLGINHPERFKKIVLSNTGCKIGNNERWNSRITTITENGMQAIVADMLERWFTDDFHKKFPEKVQKFKKMILANNVEGYASCCEAIRDADFTQQLKTIKVETLIITGYDDPVTNVEAAHFLTSKIPNSQLEILYAKHLASAEQPEKYAKILIKFFIGDSAYNKGMHVRRSVLGDNHVDTANSKINEFNADFQEFITKYAWGEIWLRPGLSKHNRSLITIAMLVALNRSAELKMHIKAAFNNGVTKDEIKEVLMHSALYCGLPAANEAIHAAEEVFLSINP